MRAFYVCIVHNCLLKIVLQNLVEPCKNMCFESFAWNNSHEFIQFSSSQNLCCLQKKHCKWWNRWLGNIHKKNLSAVLVMASFKQLTKGFKIYSINIQTTIILQNCVAKGIFARNTFSLNITNFTTNMGLLEIIILTNFMIRYILSIGNRCKRG